MSAYDRPAALEEYRALRATIRQRGTARVAIAVATILGWAALALTTMALSLPPLATLAPLLVLAGGFEAVFGLHVGVERVGRYLQVYFEAGVAEPPAWEHVAMTPRPPGQPSAGVDPLFGVLFLFAAAVNFVPVLLIGVGVELLVIGTAHVAFVTRLLVARRFALSQRQTDLAQMTTLRGQQDQP